MRIRAFLKLIRLPNSLMIGTAVLIGQYIAIKSFPFFLIALLGFLTGFLISASIMILNDYFDIEIDRINAPERPLVKGEIRAETAFSLSILLGLIGIIMALGLSFNNFIIASIFWTLGMIYNWKVKRAGFVGNIIVSLSVAIPFIYGGLSVSKLDVILILFSVMAFLSNTGRELIKGIADIEGDKLKGIKTIAVIYGKKTASFLAMFFIISSVALSILPIIYGLASWIYILLILIADTILVFSCFKVIKDSTRHIALMSKNYILMAMIIGLIAFMSI